MKGKPIEPGCLAMVVGSNLPQNNGRTVRVLYRLNAGDYDPTTALRIMGAAWLVEACGEPLLVMTIEGDERRVHRRGFITKRLIRLDDGDTPLAADDSAELPAPPVKKEVPTKEDVY